MPVDLRWRVGPSGDEPLGTDPTPTVRPPRRRVSLRPLLFAGYVMALVVAAWAGFQIGRWSDARAANLGAIANQLAVEDLAWRERDRGLYRSTLDPSAPDAWRDTLLMRFAAEAPHTYRHRVVDIAVESPGRARVTIEVEGPGGTFTEQRLYRLTGRSWFRTPE